MDVVSNLLGLYPPKYADLGKKIKDLFNKNFNFGTIKFDLRSKSAIGSNLAIQGLSEVESGKCSGFAEFKNAFYDSDMTIATKWISDNTIETEVALENRIHRGTKFAMLTKFDPKGGKFGGSCQVEYKNDFLFCNIDFGLKESKTQIFPSIVFSSQGWLAGSQFTFDPNSHKVDKPQFTVGFETLGFSLFTLLNEKNELIGSIYQGGVGDVESGVMVQLPYGANKQMNFEYAIGYSLNMNTRMLVKVDTKCQLGAAIVKNFGSGIVLSVCANMDGKNIKAGAHKVGVALEMSI